MYDDNDDIGCEVKGDVFEKSLSIRYGSRLYAFYYRTSDVKV